MGARARRTRARWASSASMLASHPEPSPAQWSRPTDPRYQAEPDRPRPHRSDQVRSSMSAAIGAHSGRGPPGQGCDAGGGKPRGGDAVASAGLPVPGPEEPLCHRQPEARLGVLHGVLDGDAHRRGEHRRRAPAERLPDPAAGHARGHRGRAHAVPGWHRSPRSRSASGSPSAPGAGRSPSTSRSDGSAAAEGSSCRATTSCSRATAPRTTRSTCTRPAASTRTTAGGRRRRSSTTRRRGEPQLWAWRKVAAFGANLFLNDSGTRRLGPGRLYAGFGPRRPTVAELRALDDEEPPVRAPSGIRLRFQGRVRRRAASLPGQPTAGQGDHRPQAADAARLGRHRGHAPRRRAVRRLAAEVGRRAPAGVDPRSVDRQPRRDRVGSTGAACDERDGGG